MSTPFNAFLTFVFSAGMLASTALTNASAGPVIDWVTPPAWLQTRNAFDFLKNSGYPVKAAPQVPPDNGAKWQSGLKA